MRANADEATLILVRHGETEWNTTGRIQGYLDSNLNALGHEQGRRVAERLRGLKITAVYSSDVGRAIITADLIADSHNLTAQQVPALRERCYGDFEGHTLEELTKENEGLVKNWLADRQRLAPPNGETEPEMSARVMAILYELAGKHIGELVVVATHGGPIKAALLAIMQAPLEAWHNTWVSNGSITILHGTSKLLRLASYNDACHLDWTLMKPIGIEN